MDMGLISLISIGLGLVVLTVLALKGVSMLIVGPMASLLVLLLSGMDVVAGMLGPYSEGFASFAKSNFLLFLLSAIFGSLMGDSGAAKDIANAVIKKLERFGDKNKTFITLMGITVISTILTLAGVSAFVLVFTMVPLCQPIFKKLDIPWHFFILALAFGGSLYVGPMIPGSPAIQNLIPMDYLGTTATAAPILAITCALISIVCGIIYTKYCINKAVKENEGYMETGAVIDERLSETNSSKEEDHVQGSVLKALIAPIVLLVTLNVFKMKPVTSMFFGCITAIILYAKVFVPQKLNKTVSAGALNSVKSLTGVCAVVAFGSVVKAVPGFEFVVSALDKIPGTPLIQLALSTNLIAGVTGSASGGLGIALETFADHYLKLGINPQLIHRVSSMSSYGLDSLPHNSAVINKLSYSGVTHKQAYKHEFWLTVVIQTALSFLAAILGAMGLV